ARADSNGVFKWTKSYYGDLWDCAATYDSGYVVVGWNGAFNENYRLYKYDKNDSLLWVKKYIGPGGGEYFLRVKELADSSIYVIGNGNLRKMRFSANGDSLGTWVPYPGLAFDTTSNGRMVFLARLAIAGPPLHTDFLLMLTDSANNLIWSRTFGGPGWETPYDVRTCADGGFVMTGIWDDDAGIGNPNPQVYVVKTDSMGYVLSSNIGNLQHMRSGLMLYPNPATETSTMLIEHFQQSRAPYQAKLYDMQGRLIQTTENIVSNEQSLSLQRLEKGLYILMLNDRHGLLYHSIKLMKE
ncbi:MAG TPA: T9SS type A sorting domain-containing protein, partial [Bacteroidia bacterium]|nr:T9SS type A sorting domain-containing protein [Bacteroidia bacterium]